MKQYYLIDPIDRIKSREPGDRSLETIIRSEAQSYVDCNYDVEDIEDDKRYYSLVHEKEREIYSELERNGIWKDEFGVPVLMVEDR